MAHAHPYNINRLPYFSAQEPLVLCHATHRYKCMKACIKWRMHSNLMPWAQAVCILDTISVHMHHFKEVTMHSHLHLFMSMGVCMSQQGLPGTKIHLYNINSCVVVCCFDLCICAMHWGIIHNKGHHNTLHIKQARCHTPSGMHCQNSLSVKWPSNFWPAILVTHTLANLNNRSISCWFTITVCCFMDYLYALWR